MKYASKYYPFSFVRASSPHPRTHTDARHSWFMTIPFTPTHGVVGAGSGISVDQPSMPRPRVTPGYLYGLARAVGRPRETARVGHRHEAAEPSREGTQDRRSRTSGESGRPAAPASHRSARDILHRDDKQHTLYVTENYSLVSY